MVDGVRRIKHIRVVVGKYSGTWWYRSLLSLFVVAIGIGLFSVVDFSTAVTGTLTQTTWSSETAGVETLTVPGSKTITTYASGQTLTNTIDVSGGEVKLAKQTGLTATHDTNTQFDTGTFTNTGVVGTGSDAKISPLFDATKITSPINKRLISRGTSDANMGKNVQIVTKPDGFPLAVYNDQNGNLISAEYVGSGGEGCHSDIGSGWKCATLTTGTKVDQNQNALALTASPSGEYIYVVYQDTSNAIRVNLFVSGTWGTSTAIDVTDGNQPAISAAAADSGYLYIVHKEDANVVYCVVNSSAASSCGVLGETDSTSNEKERAGITIDDAGRLHIVFRNKSAGGNGKNRLQYVRKNSPATLSTTGINITSSCSAGTFWDSCSTVGETPTGSTDYMDLAAGTSNGITYLHLVHLGGNNTVYRTQTSFTSPGTLSWSGFSSIADGKSGTSVSVAANSSNVVFGYISSSNAPVYKHGTVTTFGTIKTGIPRSSVLSPQGTDITLGENGTPIMTFSGDELGAGVYIGAPPFYTSSNYKNAFGITSATNVTFSSSPSTNVSVVKDPSSSDPTAYSATLSSSATTLSPTVVDSITATYSAYAPSGTLYSPIIDTTANYSILSSITGTEVAASDGGGELRVYMRTGSTVPTGDVSSNTQLSGWSNWIGQSGSEWTGTSNSGGYDFGEDIDSEFTDATNNRYFQYKLEFTAGEGTQILKDITFNFAINDDPEVSSVSATQQLADQTDEGKVVVSYTSNDPDSGTQNHHIYLFFDAGATFSSISGSELIVNGSISSFPTSGTLIVDRELITYTAKGSGKFTGITRAALTSTQETHTAGAVVWAPATTLEGDFGTGSGVAEGAGKQIVWDAKAQIAETYDTGMQVRVVAVDYNELGNTVSAITGSVSSTFTLDTGNPTFSGVTLTGGDGNTGRTNSTTVTVATNGTSDAAGTSGLTMKITGSGISNPDTAWVAYSSSRTKTLTAGDGSKSISVQLRDAHGNTSVVRPGTITLDQTAPSIPINLARQAVCITATDQDQAFISWGMPSEANHANFAGFQIDYDSSASDGTFQADIDIPTTDQTAETSYTTNIGTGSYVFAIRTYDTLENYSSPTAFTSALTLSSGCTIDSTAPTITHDSAANVNALQNSATITWTTNEDADTWIDYSTVSGTHNITQGINELTTAHSYTLTGLESGTTYYYVLRSKDGSGNETTSSEYSFSTSPGDDSSAPTISNVSVTAKQTAATVSWSTNELATSLVRITSSGDTTSNSSFTTSHAVELSGLSANTSYSITIESTDGSGNVASQNTTFTTLSSSTATYPTIVDGSVAVESITGYSAIVTWEVSNEAADSFVEYAVFESDLGDGEAPTFTDFAGSTTLVPLPGSGNAAHAVTLLGLDPETKYQFRIKTKNAGGNTTTYPLGSAVESFTTLADSDTEAPTISGGSVSVNNITESRATIRWTTNETANSWVDYSAGNTSFNLEEGTDEFTEVSGGVATHEVTLFGLTPGETYYFQVRSSDQAGNESVDHNGFDGLDKQGYTFTTIAAPDSSIAINESSIAISSITTSSAVISWTTNVQGTSSVLLQVGGVVQEFSSGGSLSTSHSVNVTGLLSRTDYTFQVASADSNGVEVISTEQQFATLATSAEVDVTPPTISGGSTPTIITTDSAVVTFTTNESASAYIEIDINDEFSENSEDYQRVEISDFSLSHTITLSTLSSATDYVYRIGATDPSGNTAIAPTDDVYSFTTADEETGEGATDNTDLGSPITAPSILSLIVKDIGGSVATVLWETDKPATEVVEYGTISESYGDIKQGTGSLDLTHNVKLTGLRPATKYYFVVKSTDIFGNEGVSDELSFTTLDEIDESELIEELEGQLEDAATEQQINILELLGELSDSTQALVEEFLDAVKQLAEEEQDKVLEIVSADLIGPPRILGARPNVKLTDTTAVIEWESTKETTSEVAYASDANYDPTDDTPYTTRAGSATEYTTQHRVEIRELTPFTIYHYQLIGTERSGRRNISVDRTFETLPVQPRFTRVRLTSVTEQSVTVSWTTNVETTGEVLVRNRESGEGRTIESLTPATTHEVTLRGLESQNRYVASVNATTQNGVSIRSNTIPFSTEPDDRAPEIQQVRTKLSIAPGKSDEVQAIISWVTDEPSNGQVFYDEGVGADGELRQRSQATGDLSFTHVVVLTKLRPATIYTFRAASTDIAGNTGESREFKIFTPRKEQSVLELIIGNFEETFGFIRNRGQ